MLEHAVAKDSTKFDNLYRLGTMYLDRDRVDEAQKVLAKAHTIKPKDVPTIVNLGAAYDALGKSAEAQKHATARPSSSRRATRSPRVASPARSTRAGSIKRRWTCCAT